ncbi:hypothetical protein PMIT1313_02648 [Prochlorococcus marinus str. MIT 1313]|nr:hypothetical protein PMIT1313_02648 [Prochlorococcus marinus str. MIT 1313]KZR77963.1 hypothetical protein PMIT1318_00046 [Prochlorococcus marinus str. MIT 1318]
MVAIVMLDVSFVLLFASHATHESDDDDCLVGELNEILHLTSDHLIHSRSDVQAACRQSICVHGVSKMIVWFLHERKQLTGLDFFKTRFLTTFGPPLLRCQP